MENPNFKIAGEDNHRFRAWDGQRFIYFSDLMIGIGKGYVENKEEAVRDKEPYVYFKTDNFGGQVRLVSHEVTQSTGLCSPEGKEIYVGDIIENAGARWEIVFNTGCFCAKRIPQERPVNGVEIALRGIVGWKYIGNKFENPELLKNG